MMKYSIVISKMATRDMQRIRKFCDKTSPSTGEKVLMQINSAVCSLDYMPMRCPVCDTNPKYRRMVVEDRYLVFYAVQEKKHEVLIRRVFDGRMDVAKRLGH
jgi:plasmid stabilization system protein ParE